MIVDTCGHFCVTNFFENIEKVHTMIIWQLLSNAYIKSTLKEI